MNIKLKSSRKNEIIKRILSKCLYNKKTDCLLWQGSTSGNLESSKGGRGYGRIKIQGKTSAVHRVMFSCIHGYVPNGIDIDHICNNRLCCNPDHLEAVTHKENCRRREIRRSK